MTVALSQPRFQYQQLAEPIVAVPGSVVWIEGWDTGGSLTAASTGGFFAYSISVVHSTAGGYSFRSNPATSSVGWTAHGLALGSTGGAWGVSSSNFDYSNVCVRFYFRAATLPAAGSEEIFSVTGTSTINVRIDSAGKLGFYNDTVQFGSIGSTVLTAGQWYRIDVRLKSGEWAVRVNGAVEISGGDTWSGNPQLLVFGKKTNRNSNTVDFYYDDAASAVGAYPPDGQVALLPANAAGTYQTFTRGGTDSGANWDQVDEIPPNADAGYVLSTGTAGNAETEQCRDLSGASSINAVCGLIVAQRNGASDGQIKLRLRSGSTETDLSGVATGFFYKAFGQFAAANPATNSAWTTSAVSAAEVGVVEDSTNATQVTFMGLVVDYVPSPTLDRWQYNNPIPRREPFRQVAITITAPTLVPPHYEGGGEKRSHYSFGYQQYAAPILWPIVQPTLEPFPSVTVPELPPDAIITFNYQALAEPFSEDATIEKWYFQHPDPVRPKPQAPEGWLAIPLGVSVTATGVTDLAVGAATLSASGTFAVATYSATADLSIAPVTGELSGTFTTPAADVYTATADVTLGAVEFAGAGAFAALVITGTGDCTIGATTITVSGMVIDPSPPGQRKLRHDTSRYKGLR